MWWKTLIFLIFDAFASVILCSFQLIVMIDALHKMLCSRVETLMVKRDRVGSKDIQCLFVVCLWHDAFFNMMDSFCHPLSIFYLFEVSR